jgi:hypothetical protein
MQLPKIKCYNGTTAANSFYVLCKGINSGKPLREPCPNCFTVASATAEESEYWYWLSWGLWKGRNFHILLRGSVIPFIRICDYQAILIATGHTASSRPESFSKALQTMRDIELYEQTSIRKLELLASMKITVFNKLLKRA